MVSRVVKFRLFHLIKDITETTESKKNRGGKTYIVETSIKRRHIFRDLISWILEIDSWEYEDHSTKKE